MAFTNRDGVSVSYDSEELIARCKEDIQKHGEAFKVWVKCEESEGVLIYTAYGEVKSSEKDIQLTLEDLLKLIEKQDSIL